MEGVFLRLKPSLANRYLIERELGSGGMTTVYRAEDRRHHRKVAVKVLRPDLASTLGPKRFLREIEVVAGLQHPHILPLLDSGEADGFLFCVMPYVEGPSLREKLAREGELPIGDAVRILRDVVDALTEAHAHGVVHRDIKPENILLRGRHALVTDFGVAKAVSEATGRQTLTTAGMALGTPAYMAPEQASADPHLDHRVDLYAVGGVAYELLTGRPVFMGTTPQGVLAAHVTEAPDPVTKHRETVPRGLEVVVMRCLAQKPADRWQSAEELLAQLEALGEEPVRVVLSTGHQPLPRRFRRLPANFSHAPYLPGLLLAERCSMMIHHGGYGSCQTGLWAGRPQVTVPTYSERESNARRVAAAGAGIVVVPESNVRGTKKHLPPESLRDAVRRVLSQPEYARSAGRLRDEMRRYGGAPLAGRLMAGGRARGAA